MLGHVGAKIQDGELEGHDADQERQDEPRWAQKAPRWHKLAPSWRDLAVSRRQEALKEGLVGAMLGVPWPIRGAFWGHLGEKAAKQKTFKNL